MFHIGTILHPTDYSDQSRPAFDMACALARDYGAELVVCHVSLPPVMAVSDGHDVEIPTGFAEQAQARLTRVRPDDPNVRTTHVLARGDEVEGILDVAAARGADLIVMGTHGRTGLSRMLMGSVAEGVSRRAECPVLTVRTARPTASGRPVVNAPVQAVPC